MRWCTRTTAVLSRSRSASTTTRSLWNPGQLPQNWTLEKLMGKHPSHPFNPLLAYALFRAGYMESWGRGIEKIRRECREHDIDAPIYDYSFSGLMLTFKANPRHLVAALGEKEARRLLGERVGERVGETLTGNQLRILSLLGQHPRLAARELAKEVGISSRKIERNIAILKRLGHLRRAGPARGGHWVVTEDQDE